MQMKPRVKLKRRESQKKDPFLVFIAQAKEWILVYWQQTLLGAAVVIAGLIFLGRYINSRADSEWVGMSELQSAYQRAAEGDPVGGVSDMERIGSDFSGTTERLALLGKGDILMQFGDSLDAASRGAAAYYEEWLDDYSGPDMDAFHALVGYAAALRQLDQPRKAGELLQEFARKRARKSPWTPIALEQAALSFIDADQFTSAKSALDQLLKDYPASPEAGRAKRVLREVEGALSASRTSSG